MTNNIRLDIYNGVEAWMEGVGWLEKEPAMKPETPENANGFDYENNIDVLHEQMLALAQGATLQLKSDYSPAECGHLTTIYCKELNAFFTSDFCYNAVHMWLAVDRKNIANWKTQLDRFKIDLADRRPAIHPGHGKPADISLFDEVKKYIEDFEATIAKSKTRAEAMVSMQGLYPGHQQADFLLFNSVNALIPE